MIMDVTYGIDPKRPLPPGTYCGVEASDKFGMRWSRWDGERWDHRPTLTQAIEAVKRS